MIKAVIIDLDDTLFLTEAVAFAMENAALSRLGRPAMCRAIHQSTWGTPLVEAIVERSPGVDVHNFKQIHSEIVAEYARLGLLDVVLDATLEALDQLIECGKQLFILTSRDHGETAHLLDPDHQLASRITAFYYRNNSVFRKPDPRVFDALLIDHGVARHEAVYIGDTLHDAVAAKRAGLHFIASLESGLRTEDDFTNHAVDLFIYNFPEVVSAVRDLESKQLFEAQLGVGH